jgi:hypothetical protein
MSKKRGSDMVSKKCDHFHPERENQEAAHQPIFLISYPNSGRDDWI